MKNKKNLRKKYYALVCAMAVLMLGGCGRPFDASKYLQAQLDNSYKNDSTLMVEQKFDTKENGQKVYEQVLDQQVEGFFAGVDASDELKERYRAIFADMLAKADYTVGESQKQSDGSYKVSVEYRKMKIFAPVVAEVEEKAAELSVADADEYIEQCFILMAEALETNLKNGVEYGDPQTLDVRIEIVNKTYTLNNEDLNALTSGLFDSEAASE